MGFNVAGSVVLTSGKAMVTPDGMAMLASIQLKPDEDPLTGYSSQYKCQEVILSSKLRYRRGTFVNYRISDRMLTARESGASSQFRIHVSDCHMSNLRILMNMRYEVGGIIIACTCRAALRHGRSHPTSVMHGIIVDDITLLHKQRCYWRCLMAEVRA